MKEEVKLRVLVLMLSLFAFSGVMGGIFSLQKPTSPLTYVQKSSVTPPILAKATLVPNQKVLGENDVVATNTPTPFSTPKLLLSPSKIPTATPSPTPSPKKTSGDVNGDSRVDLQDAAIWIAQYRGDSQAKTADLNQDTKVDLADFELIRLGIINAPRPLPTTNLGPCDSKGEVACLSSTLCRAIYQDASSEGKFVRCVRSPQ